MSVAYAEEISRPKPSCIIFLIDQSGSMADRFGGIIEGVQNPTKAQGAADALNRCLHTIGIRCSKDEGTRDYFFIGVWGYGKIVGPALSGSLSRRQLYPISQIMDTPLRVEDRPQKISDGAGGIVEQMTKFPVWIEPIADATTPMCQALREVKEIVEPWMDQHTESYPPTIINITDGASTDGDPLPIAQGLMAIANANGSNLLMFNIHICDSSLQPVLYASNTAELHDDEFAQRLFEMSSVLPEKLINDASAGGLPVAAGSRGFVFNGGLVDLIRFLDIGTRIVTMTDLQPGR